MDDQTVCHSCADRDRVMRNDRAGHKDDKPSRDKPDYAAGRDYRVANKDAFPPGVLELMAAAAREKPAKSQQPERPRKPRNRQA